jgi:hypothetical protein
LPIWLKVQTLTTHEPVVKPRMTPARILDALIASVNPASHTTCASVTTSVTTTTKRKLQGLSFDTTIDNGNKNSKLYKGKESNLSSMTSDQEAQSFVTFDLKATDSICSHLSRNCASASNYTDSCLGYLEYLEATLSSRFIFYNASNNTVTRKTQHLADSQALPINNLLQSLRTFHQLTLAHQLAVATLQYHSTSWLASDWGLRDISYFDNSAIRNPDELSERLQSLHLSTQFPSTASSSVGHATQQNQEDLRCDYGIRNLTLAKLGVVLLEIGSQAEIHDLSPTYAPHDVIRARKVLRDPPPSMQHLGKRYLKIVQKCMDCDFSCGDNLSDDDLRSAVYTEIVCGLESMIVDWRKFLNMK